MNRGTAPPPPEKPPSVAERTRLLKSSFRKDDTEKPKITDKSSTLLSGEKVGVNVSVNVANLASSSSSRVANGERSPSPTTVPSVQYQGGNNSNSLTIPNNALSGGVPLRPLVQPPPLLDNKTVNGNSLVMDSNKEQNTKTGLNAAKRDAFFKNETPPKFDPSARFGMDRERARERDIISKDVDNDRNEKHHREGHKELENYVGFANLPNQVYRKSVKKGFEFNLMVVGESGLGKSTLINSLFLTDLYSSEYPGPSLRIQKTVKVDTTQVVLKENGVSLSLTVVDTPGFGDAVDNSNCWQPVIDFIDSKYEEYLNSESRVNRTTMPDNRVHCCLYFIAPTGHGLKPLDVEFMKRLHDKVNIIPLVAKADTLTPDECRDFKKTILNEIAQHRIKIYEFPECDDEEENKIQKKLLKKDLKGGQTMQDNCDHESIQALDREVDRVPFAIVGSNTVVDNNGKRMRGRQYPWGIVEVENLEHNDFIALRNMLIRTHMQDLKDVTNNVHYENYRYSKLAPVTADGKIKASSLTKDPMTQMQEEKREHDSKMKKMEAEMEQVFEMKVKEKKTKLKDSEADLQRRAEQMKKSLEQQQKEIDDKWGAFDKEKHTWEEQLGDRRRSLENTKESKVMEKNEEKDQVEDRVLEPRRSERQGNVVSYTPKKKHKVVDKPFLKSVESFMKKNRPRSLTKEEKLDILSVQAKFRHEHVVLHSNKRPGRMKKNADATNRTANVLGRSNKLCSEIWTKFVETGLRRTKRSPYFEDSWNPDENVDYSEVTSVVNNTVAPTTPPSLPITITAASLPQHHEPQHHEIHKL